MVSVTRLNLDWVCEHLAVGGSFTESALPLLAREQRIRHVVDVRIESRDDCALLASHGLTLLHLPTRDHHAIVTDMIDRGVAWVLPRLARGERVYVHCEHGIGRSVLLTMCILVERGDTPLEALTRIKRARPCASPSPAQLDAFVAWCAGRVKSVPTWDALAQVAYRSALPAAVTAPALDERLP